MNKLVKAEWYRFWHTSKFLAYFIVSLMIILFMPFLTDIKCLELTLEQAGPVCAQMTQVTIHVVLALFVAIVIGMGYLNKTAYYEVMAGNKISHIIFSKVFVEGIVVSVAAFLAFCVVPLIALYKNGAGELEQIGIRFALMGIMILHVCIASIMMITTVRHIAGGVLVYLRYCLLEGVLMVAIELLTEAEIIGNEVNKYYQWFLSGQVNQIFTGEINTSFVIAVIGSLLLECAIWYGISYIGMKKKKYH